METSSVLLRDNYPNRNLLRLISSVVHGDMLTCADYEYVGAQNSFYQGNKLAVEVTYSFLFDVKGEVIHAAVNYPGSNNHGKFEKLSWIRFPKLSDDMTQPLFEILSGRSLLVDSRFSERNIVRVRIKNETRYILDSERVIFAPVWFKEPFFILSTTGCPPITLTNSPKHPWTTITFLLRTVFSLFGTWLSAAGATFPFSGIFYYSTQASYQLHWDILVWFCQPATIFPLPASSRTWCGYLSFLLYSRSIRDSLFYHIHRLFWHIVVGMVWSTLLIPGSVVVSVVKARYRDVDSQPPGGGPSRKRTSAYLVCFGLPPISYFPGRSSQSLTVLRGGLLNADQSSGPEISGIGGRNG